MSDDDSVEEDPFACEDDDDGDPFACDDDADGDPFACDDDDDDGDPFACDDDEEEEEDPYVVSSSSDPFSSSPTKDNLFDEEGEKGEEDEPFDNDRSRSSERPVDISFFRSIDSQCTSPAQREFIENAMQTQCALLSSIYRSQVRQGAEADWKKQLPSFKVEMMNKRLGCRESSSDALPTWQVRLASGWTNYALVESAKIEAGLRRGEKVVQIINEHGTYEIDPRGMTQRNTATSNIRSVRRYHHQHAHDSNRSKDVATPSERTLVDVTQCSLPVARRALELAEDSIDRAVMLILNNVVTVVNTTTTTSGTNDRRSRRVLPSSSSPCRAPPSLELFKKTTRELKKSRVEDLERERATRLRAKWTHVVRDLSKIAHMFLLRNGSNEVWRELLSVDDENDSRVAETCERLETFVRLIESVREKGEMSSAKLDFLRELMEPASLSWLWKRCSRSRDMGRELLRLTTYRTTSSCFDLFSASHVKLTSEEVDESELLNLASARLEGFTATPCKGQDGCVGLFVFSGKPPPPPPPRTKSGTTRTRTLLWYLFPSICSDSDAFPSIYVSPVSCSSSGPKRRYDHAAIFLPSKRKSLLVVCGGLDANDRWIGGDEFCEIFEHTLQDHNVSEGRWRKIVASKAHPSPRRGHDLALVDVATGGGKGVVRRRAVVLIGGRDATGTTCEDVWLLWLDDDGCGGERWQKISTRSDVPSLGAAVTVCSVSGDPSSRVRVCTSQDHVHILDVEHDASGHVVASWTANLEAPLPVTRVDETRLCAGARQRQLKRKKKKEKKTRCVPKKSTIRMTAHETYFFDTETCANGQVELNTTSSSNGVTHRLVVPDVFRSSSARHATTAMQLPHTRTASVMSLLLLGDDVDSSSGPVLRAISFSTDALKRPRIVRDDRDVVEADLGAARASAAMFNCRFMSDVTLLLPRIRPKGTSACLHICTDVLSLIWPGWERPIERGGSRDHHVVDMLSKGNNKDALTYESAAEILYNAFVKTQTQAILRTPSSSSLLSDEDEDVDEDSTTAQESCAIRDDAVAELVRRVWTDCTRTDCVPPTPHRSYGESICLPHMREDVLLSPHTTRLLRGETTEWISRLRTRVVSWVLRCDERRRCEDEDEDVDVVLRELSGEDLVTILLSCWQGVMASGTPIDGDAALRALRRGVLWHFVEIGRPVSSSVIRLCWPFGRGQSSEKHWCVRREIGRGSVRSRTTDAQGESESSYGEKCALQRFFLFCATTLSSTTANETSKDLVRRAMLTATLLGHVHLSANVWVAQCRSASFGSIDSALRLSRHVVAAALSEAHHIEASLIAAFRALERDEQATSRFALVCVLAVSSLLDMEIDNLFDVSRNSLSLRSVAVSVYLGAGFLTTRGTDRVRSVLRCVETFPVDEGEDAIVTHVAKSANAICSQLFTYVSWSATRVVPLDRASHDVATDGWTRRRRYRNEWDKSANEAAIRMCAESVRVWTNETLRAFAYGSSSRRFSARWTRLIHLCHVSTWLGVSFARVSSSTPLTTTLSGRWLEAPRTSPALHLDSAGVVWYTNRCGVRIRVFAFDDEHLFSAEERGKVVGVLRQAIC